MHLREALGPIYEDADFADLFPKRGRAAEAPWRLALVSVLQALENLSDRQAAEMVRGRLDGKYALSLPLDDKGFDASILTDGSLSAWSTMRLRIACWNLFCACVVSTTGSKLGANSAPISIWVIANARGLSSLESVGESLRAALGELADVDRDWLLTVISPDWFDRYVHRFELHRFPKGEQAKEDLRRQVGEDSWQRLASSNQ